MKSYTKAKWSVWGIITFSFVLVLFLRMSTAVVSDNLANELGFNSIQISNIASFCLYAYAFMQIPAGILIDKYGARKISSLGIIMASLGSILFGLIQSIELAYISRVIVGAGTSVILLCILKIQGRWFNKSEFASATAKFSFVGNLGGVLATFPLVFLSELVGWRNSFLLIGIIGVVIGCFIYIIVRDTPKEYGFNVDTEPYEKSEKVNIVDGIKSVIKNKSTWYNSMIMFSFVGLTSAFISLWGVRYIMDVYGVSKSFSAFIVSFFTYGFIFGSIIMDFVFAKIRSSKFNIIKFGAMIDLFIWIVIVVVYQVKPPIIVLPISFFIMGCIVMSHLQVFNDAKYKNKEIYSGLATSFINTFEFIGSGIINLIIAISLQVNSYNIVDGYKKGFVVFIVLSIITIVSSHIGVKNDDCKAI
ncbi:MFS transporter [Clostridioides difficile]|uniref:MFS transporter n=1 Tax=Clostridioides difficile TaxID=1496 RepID=UPI000BB1CF83|nr:MFS transporter [Clostridioides difficile]PBF15321.1 MFS transporter [Clostridioides difficile]